MNKIYHFLNCFSFILLLFGLNTNIQAQNISFTTDTAKLIGIKSFFVDEVSNKIYIAIKGGVAVSTDDGNTYTQKIFDATNQPNLTVNDIYALNNKVYVATNNGLYLSDNSGASFTKTSNGLSLPNNHASCVFVSSGGTLYIGTYAGFSVLPQGKSSFTNYSTKNTTGLGDNHVNSIYVSDGKIYLGTDYGLAISTTNDSSFINYTTANGLINNHVNSVFTSDGTVYTATDDGISVLKNNSTFTNYSKVNGLGANYVNNVYVKGSNIYAATDSGMSVLSNGRTTFSTFSTASGLGHLGDYIVYRSFVSGAKVYAITNGGLSQSLVSVSIATSTGSLDFCLDSKVTFIANPSGGGNVPTFQWKKNDINIGDNSGIYVDSTLRTNDRISCDMTPSGDAANNTVVSSNYLAMRAFPHPSVSLAINTSTGRQCINDVSLAANIVGKYQSLSWFKDSQNIVTKYVTTKNTIDYSTVFPKVITVNVYPDANYKPSSEGTYYAVVKNAIGCPDTSESFEVLPNTKATIAIGVTTGSSKICTGTPVTFSTLTTNAGNIYVAPNTGNSAIYQWKKNGSTVGTNATSYTDNSLHNNDIITCNLQASILLCPDRQSNGSPVVKTSNGITMSVSNPPSLSVGSFGNCTPNAQLLVQGATSANHISWHLDGMPLFETNGTVVAGGNGIGTNLDQFTYPSNPFIGADNTLYVPDFGNHRILQFPSGSTASTNGVAVAGIDTAGMALDQLSYPSSVFKDAFDYLFVADSKNHRIIKFPPLSMATTNGVIVAGDTTRGTALNQITPQDVYVAGSGNIYVADGENHRILKFPSNSNTKTEGIVIAGGNGVGSAANQLGEVFFFVFDATETNMYVSDAENHRILKFPINGNASTNGITVAGGNGAGDALNQLNLPSAIRIGKSGHLFVGDQNNFRVMAFPPNSTSATKGTVVVGGHGQGNALNN